MRSVCWPLLLALLLVASGARAHEAGISRGVYIRSGKQLSAELTFSHDDFVVLGRALGFADGWDKQGDTDDVAATIVEEGLRASVDDAACEARVERAEIVDGALTVHAHFSCAEDAPRIRVHVDLLDKLPAQHQHMAQRAGAETTLRLTQSSNSFDMTREPEVGADEPAGPQGFLGFMVSGVEHILTGFDHLVFLLGLVLVGRQIKGILYAVTAFTVAHSLTLGLAVLGIWAPSGSVIEPLIALSVAYVGVENFFVKDAEKRWRITLPFGLIHGFGFAGALGQIHLPRAQIPAALLAFNLGVETGQLAVLALLLPILLQLHKQPFFAKDDRGVRVLSAVVILLGLFWFVTRIHAIVTA